MIGENIDGILVRFLENDFTTGVMRPDTYRLKSYAMPQPA